MRATAPEDRTTVASPCPTSHIATVHPSGTPNFAETSGATTDPTPRAPIAAAATSEARLGDPRCRRRTNGGSETVLDRRVFFRPAPEGENTATSTADDANTASPSPIGPAGQGRTAPGRPASSAARRAIRVAGTHATAANHQATIGAAGARTHATRPATVDTGASGSARTFAGTDRAGNDGSRMTVTGQHMSCAETGTARSAATGNGSLAARRSVIRGATTRSPVVASTERANENDLAAQGSTSTIPTTAKARTGRGRARRPASSAMRTSVAMIVARTIDGSGRTSTRNARRTVPATMERGTRGTPPARPTAITRPTSTAQFEPDTAVRWLSATARIASSVASSMPERSPIASPRRSPAPGSGSELTVAPNADRARSVAASSPVGPTASDGVPRAKRTNACCSPGGSICSSPWSVSRVPAAKPVPKAVSMRSSSEPTADLAGTTRIGTR
jgi:hypothetical protein